jgi:REP element-mobilizing transposase RayT
MAKLLKQRRSRSSKSTRRFLQLSLPCRGRGGYRPGAGRPRTRAGRTGVPHRKRPVLAAAFPVHVTLRAKAGLPSLRLVESRRVLTAAIAVARDRFCCRIVHFSIQSNHIHLLCEANDQVSLSRGLRGLVIRMARGFNRAHGLRGPLWAGRYHERILRTPHHGGERFPLGCIDPCSSAPWFDGFVETLLPPSSPPPVVAARTWLLALGYRRHNGKISVDEGAWTRSRSDSFRSRAAL